MTALRVTFSLTGAGLLAFGGWLLVFGTREGTVLPAAGWLAGAVAAHDLLLAPLVLLAGLALRRPAAPGTGRDRETDTRTRTTQGDGGAPARTRAGRAGTRGGVVRGALVTAGCLTLVAMPVLLRPGTPRNPSVLPLDYPRNWALTLAATALAAACVALARRMVRDPRGPRGARSLRRQRNGRS